MNIKTNEGVTALMVDAGSSLRKLKLSPAFPELQYLKDNIDEIEYVKKVADQANLAINASSHD